MAGYLEDLVQNIYTNCDMKGLDDLNQGLRDAIWYSGELEKNIKDANQAQKSGFDFHARAIERSKEAYKVESLRQKLEYQQAIYRTRLAEQQEIIDERRQRRQDRYNKSLNSQNWLLRRAGRLLLAFFGINTLKNIIDTTTRIDLLQKSLYGLTKSTQDWEYVQEQAFVIGTKFETVAKCYRNFFSSARMAGFDKEGIQDMYSGVLLSSRAIGASAQQTEGALLALEQMLSKGTVSMEELRRQLGNAIPGAFEIGAKAMNMTTAEFNAFIKKGQLASAVFVPKFVKALVDEYGGGMEEIRKSTSFALTNLSNAWVQLQVAFMSGQTGQEFAKAINLLTDLLRSEEFKDFVKILGTIFKYMVEILSFAIKHLKTIIVLLGAGGMMMILPQLLKYLQMLGLAVGFITSAGVINGIKTLVASFWSMLAPFMALYAKILLVISALLILQDIYTAIRYPNKKSLARREWNGENATFGASQSGLNPFGTPQTVKEKMQEYEQLKTKPMEMYSSPSAGLLNGSLFNKSEQKNVNISLGDINVNSQNGNPIEIAQVVQDKLVELFTGQGLTMGVQDMVE